MRIGPILASALYLLEVNALVAVADEPASAQVQKRDKKIINKDYNELMKQKMNGAESSAGPTPWVRTISSTIPEIVTPTVIGGVTFNAKPPKTTDGLEPWVSIQKNGAPKTIKPKLKNGRVQNGSPTYGTWFASATTVTYNKEQLKAHNMAEDQIHTEVEYIKEDDTYVKLIPILRCTPDKYAIDKQTIGFPSSEPFCYPRDNSILHVDKTYFITWYSKFFEPEVDKVKIHLARVKESLKHKGTKRNLNDLEYNSVGITKRANAVDKGGQIQGSAFYVSDWVNNQFGYFPLTINKDWLGKEFDIKVLISIQPSNIPDEEFDIMNNYVVVEFAQGAKVSKEHQVDLKKLEQKQKNRELGIEEMDEEIDYEKWIAIMTMPTVVALAALGMYFFVMINKNQTDLSHLKKRKFAGINTTHRRIPFKTKKKDGYSELPQYSEGTKMD